MVRACSHNFLFQHDNYAPLHLWQLFLIMFGSVPDSISPVAIVITQPRTQADLSVDYHRQRWTQRMVRLNAAKTEGFHCSQRRTYKILPFLLRFLSFTNVFIKCCIRFRFLFHFITLTNFWMNIFTVEAYLYIHGAELGSSPWDNPRNALVRNSCHKLTQRDPIIDHFVGANESLAQPILKLNHYLSNKIQS